MTLLDGSKPVSVQPPSYQSPRGPLDALEGFEASPTSTPLTSGSLPDELSSEIAILLGDRSAIQEALDELKLFVNLYGSTRKYSRWGPALEVVTTQLKLAMALLEEIGSLDAQRGNTHDRLIDIGCDSDCSDT